jgi:hypothetical protein
LASSCSAPVFDDSSDRLRFRIGTEGAAPESTVGRTGARCTRGGIPTPIGLPYIRSCGKQGRIRRELMALVCHTGTRSSNGWNRRARPRALHVRLSMLPRTARATVDERLTHAHAWLRASELPQGGWGYTEQTGADAVSMSLALLFFIRAETTSPPKEGFGPTSSRMVVFRRSPGTRATAHGYCRIQTSRRLCLTRLGKADDPLAMECVRTLQSKQLPDGSWASESNEAALRPRPSPPRRHR